MRLSVFAHSANIIWNNQDFFIFLKSETKKKKIVDKNLEVHVKDEESFPNIQNLIKRKYGCTFSNVKCQNIS